jgi:hypothetical protein
LTNLTEEALRHGLSADGEREPIAVFGAHAVTEGWVPIQVARITDSLSDAERMRVGTPGPDGGDEWVQFDLDEVIAVAPAPRPPSPARVAGRHYAVEVVAGPYVVHGVAHVPLGADPERYVSRSGRQWLPLTECTVVASEDEWAVEVVIVNLDHVTHREITSYPPAFL